MANTAISAGPGTSPGVGGTLPPEVRISYAATLLRAAMPRLIHAQFCTDMPIPQHQGTTMQMRRFENLAPATNPLQEGVTPAGNVPTVSQVTVSVKQYGDYVLCTDVATWVLIDNTMVEINKRLGFQSSQTIDVLLRAGMILGTNVLYANNRVSRVTVAAGDNFTNVEIKKAARTLETASVEPYEDDCYVGIIHPYTKYDFMSITEWLAVKEYSDRSDLYKGEVGELYSVRFVKSPMATPIKAAGAAGIDVWPTLIFGRDAFAKSAVDGHSLENIIHPPGSAGAADALNQRSTSGWKITLGVTITNQTFVVRVEHAATA